MTRPYPRSHGSSAERLARVAWAAGVFAAYLGCGLERVELRRLDSQSVDSPVSDEPEAGRDAGTAASTETPSPNDVVGDGFDVGDPAEREAGCTKVDFLFVVDNSISMFQEQENLSRSFPRFMQVVEDNLEAKDFHIMVVDTDGWDGEGPRDADIDPCGDDLGAGKRSGALGQACGADGTARYLEDGQGNLADTFACIARVGTFGDSGEQPMDAMLQATSVAKNGAAGCNAGFLRDDAILVVTFITDEDDENSSGTPDTWRQALLAAKHDDQDAVVVLGLVGDNNLDQPLPGGPCGFLSASGAPRLQSFVSNIEHGSLASVCADDYGQFFEAAVNSIDTACDLFVPPAIQ